jgi:hypothetical protein
MAFSASYSQGMAQMRTIGRISLFCLLFRLHTRKRQRLNLHTLADRSTIRYIKVKAFSLLECTPGEEALNGEAEETAGNLSVGSEKAVRTEAPCHSKTANDREETNTWETPGKW